MRSQLEKENLSKNQYKNKNNIRTFQPQGELNLITPSIDLKLTGSYIKKVSQIPSKHKTVTNVLHSTLYSLQFRYKFAELDQPLTLLFNWSTFCAN